MKKFILKLIVLFLILAAIFLPAAISLDPYNVFHCNSPRYNGIEANKGFIKTKHILRNMDKYDCLLFGSSRAGYMDIEYLNGLTGLRWYDMASSESLVCEQTNELNVLLKAGFKPKRIAVLVDDISCFVDPELHENMLYRVPYPSSITDALEFYSKYVDFFMLYEANTQMRNNTKTDDTYTERFLTTGTERLDIESSFDPSSEENKKGYFLDYYAYRGDMAIKEMEELALICKENNIELTVMTSPLYCLTFTEASDNGYLDYLKKLAAVTEYYNFSGISDVTYDYRNYYETSHFTPAVSHMMLEACFSTFSDSDNYKNTDYDKKALKKQGFGLKVTADNVDDLFEVINE